MEELYATNLEITRKKNADYAGVGDPFKNFNLCQDLGITSVESGLLVRMTDKLSRISTLLNKEAQVNDEAIIDTLSDLSNYAMILRIYIEQKNA
jgi:hypothetical protein